MTYNFDPDKWYDIEFVILKTRLEKKEFSPEEFDLAVQALEQKHEEMWNRLNGTYQIIPDNSSQPSE